MARMHGKPPSQILSQKRKISLSSTDNTSDDPDYEDSGSHTSEDSSVPDAAIVEESVHDEPVTEPKSTKKTKHGGYNRVERECPICSKIVKRPAQHFRQTHAGVPYEDYKHLMVFSKDSADVLVEVDRVVSKNQSIGKTACKVLEENGLYVKCTRCPLLEEYRKHLQLVEEARAMNVAMYVNKVSYIVQYCCSKTGSSLDANDLMKGLKKNLEMCAINIETLTSSTLAHDYLKMVLRFIIWLRSTVIMEDESAAMYNNLKGLVFKVKVLKKL